MAEELALSKVLVSIPDMYRSQSFFRKGFTKRHIVAAVLGTLLVVFLGLFSLVFSMSTGLESTHYHPHNQVGGDGGSGSLPFPDAGKPKPSVRERLTKRVAEGMTKLRARLAPKMAYSEPITWPNEKEQIDKVCPVLLCTTVIAKNCRC